MLTIEGEEQQADISTIPQIYKEHALDYYCTNYNTNNKLHTTAAGAQRGFLISNTSTSRYNIWSHNILKLHHTSSGV